MTWRRVDPNPSSAPLDDLFYDGESDSRSAMFHAGIQPLKDAEYFVRVLRFKPQSVVHDPDISRN
jgi:hypothetical protein